MTIEAQIATRLFRKQWSEWSLLVETDPNTVWASVLVPAVQTEMGASERANLLRALFGSSDQDAGAVLRAAVARKVRADADARVTEMLADGSLSLAELAEIL